MLGVSCSVGVSFTISSSVLRFFHRGRLLGFLFPFFHVCCPSPPNMSSSFIPFVLRCHFDTFAITYYILFRLDSSSSFRRRSFYVSHILYAVLPYSIPLCRLIGLTVPISLILPNRHLHFSTSSLHSISSLTLFHSGVRAIHPSPSRNRNCSPFLLVSFALALPHSEYGFLS
jgi:hypothetical protein